MSFLPKIYPITETNLFKLSHFEQCKRLIEGGAELIQIRDKNALSDEFFAFVSEVVKFANSKDVKILVNDRADIALTANAHGVHLGQGDLPPTHARKLLGDNAIIGYSTHNVEQAFEAMTFPIDYIAIGPIFPTKSKENPEEIVGLEGIRRVRESVGDFPLVAIGGIDYRNIKEVFKAGADSVAIISGLLSYPKRISHAFSELNSTASKTLNTVKK